MICPTCKSDMIVVEHDNVELDYCTDCNGVWFDAGEFQLLLETMQLEGTHITIDSLLKMTEAISEEMRLMVEGLLQIATEKGIEDLISPFESIEGGMATNPEDIIEVRNEVSELKSLMEEVRGFLDQEINKPIIHAWFEGD